MNGIDFDPRPSMALYLAGAELEIRKRRKQRVDLTSAEVQIGSRQSRRILAAVWRLLTLTVRGATT